MFAVIVNALAIVAGTLIGLLLRRGIPDRLNDALMQALGLCVLVIGMAGAIPERNVLIMIISVALGTVFGEALHLEDRVNAGARALTSRFAGSQDGARLAAAFVTSCLIMNVGAMVIVGSLEAGLRENFATLYTKSTLDFVSGIMLAAAMGAGVLGSAVFTLVFQGAIVLGAGWIAPLLSDAVVAELSCTGSVMILAIGLNMLRITTIKVINLIPALLFVIPVMKCLSAAGL